jgi:hypothetical protein
MEGCVPYVPPGWSRRIFQYPGTIGLYDHRTAVMADWLFAMP